MDLTAFRILDALSRNPGKEYSINGLVRRMRELGYSAYYKNVYDRIQGLKGQGILEVKKTGNLCLVSLDFSNPAAIDELAVLEFERKKRLLEKHGPYPDLISEMDSTPIDSIIIVQPERNLKLNALELLYLADAKDAVKILENCRNTGKKHNMAVYPLILTKNELKETLSGKELSPVKGILEDKVVLINPSGFWKTVGGAGLQETKEIVNPKKIFKAQLQYNLARFGYAGFTQETVDRTDEWDVESIVTACLLPEDARLRESIPILLAKNKVNYRILLYLALKYRKVNAMGYFIEATKTLTEDENKRKTLEESLRLFELFREPAVGVEASNSPARRWGIPTKTTLEDLRDRMRLYNAV